MWRWFKNNKLDVLIAVLLLIIGAFLLFWKINAIELADWDEGIYANIAGEMVENGDWLRLKIQGVDWYEKEPLPYWLMAISLKLLGFTVFAVRLPFVLFSTFIPPLLYILSRYWLDKTWALLTSVLVFVSPFMWLPHILRTGDFDALTLVWLLSAITAYLYGRDKKWWWLSPIFVALALMSRGVMGILYIAIIISAECVRRFYKEDFWGWKKLFYFVIISLAPWLVWHWYWFVIGGQKYIHVYWKDQFFTRINSPLHNHSGPPEYYVNIIADTLGIKYLLVFIFGVMATILFALKKSWKFALLFLWLFFLLVPIHIIQTKLYWYLLPVLPALYLATTATVFKIIHLLPKYKKIVYLFFTILFIFHTVRVSAVTITDLKNKSITPNRDFIYHALEIVPDEEKTIILFDTQGWAAGYSVLPRFYWYLHFEGDKTPIFTNTAWLAGHLEQTQNPYWIVSDKALPDLDNFEKISYEILYNEYGHNLIKVNLKT